MSVSPVPLVRISDEELRRLFNEGRYWERLQAGELRAQCRRDKHPAPPGSGQPYCTRSQEVSYFDANDQEVARAHQYLKPDGNLGGSGRPDPKRILQGGVLVVALQELIRRKRIEELKSMMGAVRLEIDIPESRRRS